jgi:hypothetical protein
MVFITTFNIISVISWRSVLLVKETRLPVENPDLPQVTDKLYHIILYRVQHHNTKAVVDEIMVIIIIMEIKSKQ